MKSGVAATETVFRPGFVHGVLLLMAVWLNGMASGAIAPVLPRIAQQFAGTPNLDLLVGFVGTIPALAAALLAIPIGLLADRVGQRRTLLTGLLIYGLFGVAPIWIESLHGIVASRFFVGIGDAAVTTTGTSILGMYFTGRTRDRWFSAQVATANVMGVILVFVGGLLGTAGWRTPFAIYVVALLLFVPTFLFIHEPASRAVHAVEPAAAAVDRAVLRRLVLNLLLAVLLATVIFVIIIQMSFLLAERGAADSGVIGTAISLAACGIVVGATGAGLLARYPARGRLAASFGVIAAGLLGVAGVGSLWATVACAFAAGIGCGVGVATALGATIAAAPASILGRVSGAWTSAIFLGQFLNPPLFVAGRRLLGSLPVTIAAFALLCGAVGLALAVVRSEATTRRGETA